jgi:hypothetical protein
MLRRAVGDKTKNGCCSAPEDDVADGEEENTSII